MMFITLLFLIACGFALGLLYCGMEIMDKKREIQYLKSKSESYKILYEDMVETLYKKTEEKPRVSTINPWEFSR